MLVTKPQKRKKVEATLMQYGARLLRHGGRHDVWGCPCGRHQAPLPRHSDITAGVIANIDKQMGCLPKGWLAQ